MGKIQYEYMKKSEVKEVSNLIKEIFKEFIGIDYNQEGKDTFLDYIAPNNLRERYNKKNHEFLIAEDNGVIIGIIELRDYNHISLLFVHKNYHSQRIAKNLFNKANELCKQYNPDIEEIVVNSSLYAEKIYKKLGFKKVNTKQEKDGIIYIPMCYKIKSK